MKVPGSHGEQSSQEEESAAVPNAASGKPCGTHMPRVSSGEKVINNWLRQFGWESFLI